MPRVMHFDIPADDPEQAAAFYAEAFGWKTETWGDPPEYWLVSTGEPDTPGIDGGIFRRQPGWETPVNIIDVASLDDAVAAVRSAGGQIVREKQAVPGVGWLAYFEDPEGNVFGMMETDEGAA